MALPSGKPVRSWLDELSANFPAKKFSENLRSDRLGMGRTPLNLPVPVLRSRGAEDRGRLIQREADPTSLKCQRAHRTQSGYGPGPSSVKTEGRWIKLRGPVEAISLQY